VGGSLVEASLFKQDRAEIEIGPRDPVFVLQCSLELQRLAHHLFGAIEILRLAIEQSEIAGGDRGNRDLSVPVGDGEALEQHLLGFGKLPEALQQQTEIGVELG